MIEPAAARPLIDRSVLAAPMPIADRLEYGRSARERVPLEALGQWDPAVRGASALDLVLAQNTTRVRELVPVRMGRMSVSAWTYYRGAAAVMAADLASSAHTGLDVQLCGDAHVLNFGLWATPERQLSFDLRDFDETLRGPFEWDVKRFARQPGRARSRRRTAREHRPRRRSRPRCGRTGSGSRAMRPRAELEIWYDLVTADVPRPAVQTRRARACPPATCHRAEAQHQSVGAARKPTSQVDGASVDHRGHAYLRPSWGTAAELAEVTDLLAETPEAYHYSPPTSARHLFDRFTFVDVVSLSGWSVSGSVGDAGVPGAVRGCCVTYRFSCKVSRGRLFVYELNPGMHRTRATAKRSHQRQTPDPGGE